MKLSNNEAAEMIKDDIRLHGKFLSGKYRHALRLAIKALETAENELDDPENPSNKSGKEGKS